MKSRNPSSAWKTACERARLLRRLQATFCRRPHLPPRLSYLLDVRHYLWPAWWKDTVRFSPPPPAPQQRRACLQPREGRVQPSEAVVQGQQGGGHRRPGLWGKGLKSSVDFCHRTDGAPDAGALSCGPLRPVLQALRIRSQALALGKVELVERMQSPKDWTSPAVWTEALCVPAQSLHLGAAPSWGIFARHCVGGCFAAACLASTLYGSSNAPPV